MTIIVRLRLQKLCGGILLSDLQVLPNLTISQERASQINNVPDKFRFWGPTWGVPLGKNDSIFINKIIHFTTSAMINPYSSPLFGSCEFNVTLQNVGPMVGSASPDGLENFRHPGISDLRPSRQYPSKFRLIRLNSERVD